MIQSIISRLRFVVFVVMLSSALITFADPANSSGSGINDLLKARRIVFLGDSITYGGEYVEFVEAYLRMTYPDFKGELLDLGLPSETVSGLSEPGHAGGAFPRPDLHERLGRVLKKTRPDLIFACYGMNDGIYYPFSEERFAKFKDGIVRLRNRAAASKAKIIILTPPTFDALPIKEHTLPAGLAEYRQPFEGYNRVLDSYSTWLLSQRTNGWAVVDAHGPMNRFLAEQRRDHPNFLLAGDGVHANTQGNWIIAREILRFLGAPENVTAADDSSELSKLSKNGPEILKLVQRRQRLLKDAWLTETGHLRPGMNKGKPLADAQKQADEIELQLQTLTSR
jgi:lysophospholipase L1-like esterase